MNPRTGPGPGTAELHALSGAYALHALSGPERTAFERHVSACPPCAQEVRELTATAARLGGAVAVEPPPELRARVLRRITAVRQEPPRVPRQPPGPAGDVRAGSRRLPGLLLAACAAGLLLVSGVAVWQHREADQARRQAAETAAAQQEVMSVLAAPDARMTGGPLPGGGKGTVVVSSSADRAVFLASGLPQPPDGMVYQLWFDDAGTMRPAGLLQPEHDGGTEAMLMDGALGRAAGMGITVEPAGGSREPSSEPLAVLPFPAPAA
ncbi:anti-sigma factor [Streptomyces aidingensis]|uniref:Regulator of SigK n=1 Tax=Streptomyces aidingensis TaxID=910347 RepID=A0A1I1JB10_9ACTN|nr:anti-sigma factor [Streptomyces aidingensis]SFC42620.1 Anti-sigma-K factor RskA [Streptomyces aidingensis]